jgi:hypothetical protein
MAKDNTWTAGGGQQPKAGARDGTSSAPRPARSLPRPAPEKPIIHQGGIKPSGGTWRDHTGSPVSNGRAIDKK